MEFKIKMEIEKNKQRKKEEFKKLFYSDLTEAEIKEILCLDYKEYRELLREVKKDLGLPTNYRRKPKRYWKYTDDSYYILKRLEDDFEIISYCPTEEMARIKLESIADDDEKYEIGIASDENLIRLIKEEYLVKRNNGEKIMRKFKLPYHKFYYLLNILKDEYGIIGNAIEDKRFIYKYTPTQRFVIKKYVNGKYTNFGYYDDVNVAIKVRDYLENINWDVEYWKNNKNSVVGEIENE